MPLILGNECSGIVEKVGVNVKNFKIGDKVYARLAINKPGSFAEYVAINYKDVAKMPGDIDFKTAAAIPLTGLTAYQAFKDILKVKGGESVLVTGGSGSFGQMAVPIAKEFNLNVYLSGNAASKDNFLKLGVSQYFSYEKDDYSKSLKDQDHIIDTLGDKEIEKEAKCLKNGGKLLSLRGTPNKTFAEKNNINCVKKFLFSLAGRKNDNLLKKINGSYEFMFVTSNGNELEKITEIVSKNHIRPLVNERNFKLEDFNEVLDYFLNGKPKGKIVYIND